MWTLEIKTNEDIAIISRRRVMLELYVSMEIQSIILAALRYLRLLASTPDIAVKVLLSARFHEKSKDIILMN